MLINNFFHTWADNVHDYVQITVPVSPYITEASTMIDDSS